MVTKHLFENYTSHVNPHTKGLHGNHTYNVTRTLDGQRKIWQGNPGLYKLAYARDDVAKFRVQVQAVVNDGVQTAAHLHKFEIDCK